MRYALIVMMGVALGGCGLELLAGTAIESELQSQQMSNIKPTLDYAKNTTSTLSVQQAVDAYAAEKGGYPPSLDVLVPEWLPNIPKQADGSPFNYDPNTGRVTDGTAPAQPAVQQKPTIAQNRNADQKTMEEIKRAIDKYGQTTGYYPASLQVLVPYYLATLPKTSSGMDFVYDPQTGALSLPAQANTAQRPQMAQPVPQTPSARKPAVGGGGPMMETMTGIGIQQELNGMSNAGASAVGNRLRQQAKDLGNSRQ